MPTSNRPEHNAGLSDILSGILYRYFAEFPMLSYEECSKLTATIYDIARGFHSLDPAQGLRAARKYRDLIASLTDKQAAQYSWPIYIKLLQTQIDTMSHSTLKEAKGIDPKLEAELLTIEIHTIEDHFEQLHENIRQRNALLKPKNFLQNLLISTECDFLRLDEFNERYPLNTLPIPLNNYAYILTNRRLFYIDKKKKTIQKIQLTEEAFNYFHTYTPFAELNNQAFFTLTHEQLASIRQLTNHSHTEYCTPEPDSIFIVAVKKILAFMVKVMGIFASLGPGLTFSTIFAPAGVYHPALSWILAAIGTLVFSSLYLTASIELLSFKTWSTILQSICSLGLAAVFSIPSAKLNKESLSTQIQQAPYDFSSHNADWLSDVSEYSSYGVNFILNQACISGLFCLISIYLGYLRNMPNISLKLIFILRKLIGFGLGGLTCYSLFVAGRVMPRIENTTGSWMVSVIENIGDLAYMGRAYTLLPWLGSFSLPISWQDKIWCAVTGMIMTATIYEYNRESLEENISILENSWVLVLLLVSLFGSFHAYAPCGVALRGLITGIISFVFNAIAALCKAPQKISSYCKKNPQQLGYDVIP